MSEFLSTASCWVYPIVKAIACVYVPNRAAGNLNLGLERGAWGWNEAMFASKTHGPVLRALTPGQWIILATGGPDPRRPSTWADESRAFVEIAVVEITAPVYRSATPLWPDKMYPIRISFDTVIRLRDVTIGDVGGHLAEGLRSSANGHGAAYLAQTGCDEVDFVRRLAGVSPPSFSDAPRTQFDATLLDQIMIGLAFRSGSSDQASSAIRRAEHGQLRNGLFGDASIALCDLCLREFPVQLLVTAHIKPRARCSELERWDSNVVMRNCSFGCDALYERRAVVVDSEGIIRIGNGIALGISTELLQSLVLRSGVQIGSRCPAYSESTAAYFAWRPAPNSTVGTLQLALSS